MRIASDQSLALLSDSIFVAQLVLHICKAMLTEKHAEAESGVPARIDGEAA